MATILGLRDVKDFVADERPKNWREMILYLYPRSEQKAPLNALIAGMKREPTNDPEFNWFEKASPVRYTTVNYSTGYASTVTTLVVVSSAPFRAHDLVRNDMSDEVMRVVSDPTSATEIVVARGWGSTADTVDHADVLIVIGNAISEGAAPPSSLYTDPTKASNLTQIFRHPLNLTNTAKATRLRTGKAYAQMKHEALDLHTIDMERAFIWGVKNEDLTGSEPRRSTGGIISFLTTNKQAVSGGNLTAAIWDAWLRDIFKFGSSERLVLCGNQFLQVINQMAEARGTINLQVAAAAMGIAVTKWVTPFGVVYLKNHPLFNEITAHMKSALFLDLNKIVYRPLVGNGENRDTKFLKDRQARGEDKTTDEYLTECGLEVHHQACHGWMTNVNAWSAS